MQLVKGPFVGSSFTTPHGFNHTYFSFLLSLLLTSLQTRAEYVTFDQYYDLKCAEY